MKRGQFRRFLGVHPGGRLVEQQQRRLGRQGAGDLHPPLVAVGELGREAVEGRRRAAPRRPAARGRARGPRAPRRAPTAGGRSRRPGPARIRACRPTITFSTAVIAPNSRMFWKVRATPRGVMTSGRARVMFLPSSLIRPEVGRIRPVSMLKKVVLPAPFGPITETIECAGMSNDTSLTAVRPPNRLMIRSAPQDRRWPRPPPWPPWRPPPRSCRPLRLAAELASSAGISPSAPAGAAARVSGPAAAAPW